MSSDAGVEGNVEVSPEEWLRRLTVKVEASADGTFSVGGKEREEGWHGGGNKAAGGSGGKSKEKRKEQGGKKAGSSRHASSSSSSKASKEEQLLTPTSAPVYTPALVPSQLPFGSSQVVESREHAFSCDQMQLLDLTSERSTGLWRMHVKSGVNYRKGPFTTEERMLVEEALDQYAKREGFSSVEEAVRSLSGNVGRKNSGRFQAIARCLPDRPFVSIYGYIRRRISGNVKRGPWTEAEAKELIHLASKYTQATRGRWVKIGALLNRRPADVCDKWRVLEPRLRQLQSTFPSAAAGALEDGVSSGEPVATSQPEGGSSSAASGGGGDEEEARLAAHVDAAQFDETRRQQLLLEVQQRTGEDLPSFAIPWRRIQGEAFPHCEHALLRHLYFLVLFPIELEKRMGVKPRPVVLRHILRCLSRLEGPLPTQLRGIEWLEILPFVPGCLQREVVRAAAGSLAREKGVTLDAAIPRLLEEHAESLECMRKRDAFRLLRAALPVPAQEALEAKVLAKGALEGWSKDTLKKKLRRRIRKSAAEELQRLRARLQEVKATPLNTPPRGRGMRALLSAAAEAREGHSGGEGCGDAAAADGPVAALLNVSFAEGLRGLEEPAAETKPAAVLLREASPSRQEGQPVKEERREEEEEAEEEKGALCSAHAAEAPANDACSAERREDEGSFSAACSGAPVCSMTLRSALRHSKRRRLAWRRASFGGQEEGGPAAARGPPQRTIPDTSRPTAAAPARRKQSRKTLSSNLNLNVASFRMRLTTSFFFFSNGMQKSPGRRTSKGRKFSADLRLSLLQQCGSKEAVERCAGRSFLFAMLLWGVA
ncbi:hypothetical protein Esti_003454 [Eimeria stiedai]